MLNEEANYVLTDLYLYITDFCNLSCAHCWISPGFSHNKQNGLRLEYLKKTILEAKSLGLQNVKITGGEPLLYQDIDRLLEFLAAEEITVFIESNGTLIDRDMIDRFQSCYVEQVSVSLDAASEEVHDEIRGVKGSFNLTLKSLSLLSDSGINFQIIMTLQRKNKNEVLDVIQLCENLGASSLKINPLVPSGRAREVFKRNGNLELDELIDLHRMVEEKWSREDGLEIVFDLPVAFRSIEEIKRRGIVECRILNILGVLANGDFSICGIGQTIDALRMGNLYHDSICDIWNNSPLLNELRQSLPEKLKGICSHCIFKFQCLGACRANAYALTGNFYEPYFLCQEFFESGFFPPSRFIQ